MANNHRHTDEPFAHGDLNRRKTAGSFPPPRKEHVEEYKYSIVETPARLIVIEQSDQYSDAGAG